MCFNNDIDFMEKILSKGFDKVSKNTSVGISIFLIMEFTIQPSPTSTINPVIISPIICVVFYCSVYYAGRSINRKLMEGPI